MAPEGKFYDVSRVPADIRGDDTLWWCSEEDLTQVGQLVRGIMRSQAPQGYVARTTDAGDVLELVIYGDPDKTGRRYGVGDGFVAVCENPYALFEVDKLFPYEDKAAFRMYEEVLSTAPAYSRAYAAIVRASVMVKCVN